MRCVICNKTEDECILAEGIYNNEISKICISCANKEAIPLIKKPTTEQLSAASEVNYSVRERLEKISGTNQRKTKEQTILNSNIANIKFPKKRQNHENLIENYDWKLKTVRRRKKLSISQLAKLSGVNIEDITSLEKGQLISGLEANIVLLEGVLDTHLLKNHETRIKFTVSDKSPEEIENRILNNVSEKIEKINQPKKENIFKKIASGKFDFSKRENIENVTLNDLAEMKKEKEKNELMGSDEIEIEEEMDESLI